LTFGTQEYGLTDTASQARFLMWMNEIQNDIADSYKWPFLKFKMKKLVEAGEQEIDISPDIPAAPLAVIAAGGTLTTSSVYKVKITFVIFDESGKEYASIESEPSVESSSCTATLVNATIALTSIPLFSGTSTVKPNNIYRRIYLSKDGGAYYLYSTITDNSTTTANITADTSSTIEPPEFSLVSLMSSEDPLIVGSSVSLSPASLDEIQKGDPGNASSGTPRYYARTSETKIYLYPKPSTNITITYWVYRIPSRIFNEATRALQINQALKSAFDQGVTWKSYKYRQDANEFAARQLYEQLKKEAHKKIGRAGGSFGHVKEV
jgi:hypothetical protein